MKTLIKFVLSYMNIYATCGNEFQTDDSSAVYCSSTCAGK